jgi:hypothetical protein
MFRPLLGTPRRDFERAMLRKSVGELSAGRSCCAHCGRTPLTGEVVHVYARGRVVCALCRPGESEDPMRSEAVRHSERGQTVRLRPAPAA